MPWPLVMQPVRHGDYAMLQAFNGGFGALKIGLGKFGPVWVDPTGIDKIFQAVLAAPHSNWAVRYQHYFSDADDDDDSY